MNGKQAKSARRLAEAVLLRGPYQQKSKTHSPYYLYTVSGFKNVATLIILLWPWLSLPKREQAEKALAAAEIYRDKPRKIRADKGQIRIKATKAYKSAQSANIS